MLESSRTRLRRFQLSDLDNLLGLESDPDVVRFTPLRLPQAAEQVEKRLRRLVEQESRHAPFGVWAAELKDSGEFVGWFMVLPTGYEFPELGFMVLKHFWGRGLALEICRRLIGFAFAELGAVGLMARTDSENYRSIRILKKLGFRGVETQLSEDQVFGRAVATEIFEFRASASAASPPDSDMPA